MLNVSSPPPPYSSGAPSAQSPAALVLRGEALEVLLGDAGRVRIEPLLERNDLLADETPDLLAKPTSSSGSVYPGNVVTAPP